MHAALEGARQHRADGGAPALAGVALLAVAREPLEVAVAATGSPLQAVEVAAAEPSFLQPEDALIQRRPSRSSLAFRFARGILGPTCAGFARRVGSPAAYS